MKKLFTLTAFFLAGVVAFSQYYYVKQATGQNPGGLNTDGEYPVGGGLPNDWTVALAANASAVWSTQQSIPFSFDFDGSTVSNFYVSNSGIVTFNNTPGTAPGFTPAPLPDAAIPDMSVGVWGIQGITVGSDNVATKTFGAAPNRQFWILFSSFQLGTSSSWSYWSVVLEETSNKIYIVDQRQNATSGSIYGGIQIDNSNAISIIGLMPEAGNDATPADNVYYEFIPGTQPANDAAIISVDQSGYIPAGNVNITGTIKNFGTAPITSIDVKYSDGTNTYTDSKTGLNIASNTTYQFTHATPLNLSGVADLDVWVELSGDANSANDMASTSVSGYTSSPPHTVAFEEATGTWCGWCPRGHVYMEEMHTQHPDALLIAVHNSDPMEDATYDAGIGALPDFSGYPSVIVNRKEIVDPTDLATAYTNHIGDFGFADVAFVSSFDAGTRELNVDVTVSPTADQLPGAYRLALVLTEDGVTGTGDGTNTNNQDYDQVNYYSYQTLDLPLVGAGHDWQTETNPIPATNMIYNFVARVIVGGFSGQPGSLPSGMTAGGTYTYHFSYTIPAGFNENTMKPMVLLVNSTGGEILNGHKSDKLNSSVGIEHPTVDVKFDLYPNPADNSINLSVDATKNENGVITVSDMLGRNTTQIYEGSLGSMGTISYDISNLSSGMYLVSVATDGGVVSKSFVKQ